MKKVKINYQRVKSNAIEVCNSEAIIKLSIHPGADNISEYVRLNNHDAANATVCKIFEALVEIGLIKK